MTINIHLFDDFKAIAVERLRSLVAGGLRVHGLPQGAMPNEDWFSSHGLDFYFEYLHRKIEPKPRRVYVCSGFDCPEDLKDEYSKIVEEIESGADLSARQTYRIERIGNCDGLLNDWGLHHLHFSTRTGVVWGKNDNRLLYVYVADESVYIIRVGTHDDFCNIDVIDELNKDFPQLFGHLSNGHGTSKLTREEVGRLRKANVNVVQVLDGGAVSCLGGGVVCNGISAAVYHEILVTRRCLDNIEQFVALNFQDEARKQLENHPEIYNANSICLKLLEIDNGIVRLRCELPRLLVSICDDKMKISLC